MFLQLWPVIYIVQTRQTIVGLGAMAGKKIELEEAIREILVTDTAWELGAEASVFED
jgi:hypothetical protein